MPFSFGFPNWEDFLKCLRREATPERTHYIELIIDGEVQDWICQQYGLLENLSGNDPYYIYKKQIALQSFLGYDYVVVPGSLGESLGFRVMPGPPHTALQRAGGR
jgi:hypothetical protein